MRVLGLGMWVMSGKGLGLALYILYHNLSYGLVSFTIKLPVISITRPGATGGGAFGGDASLGTELAPLSGSSI